jgi:hypothetical protein
MSADIMDEEGAEQESIAAHRTRDHLAKSRMCTSEVRRSKANEYVQHELMSLQSVLQPRMNINLIVTRRRAIRDSLITRSTKETWTWGVTFALFISLVSLLTHGNVLV